jgi:Tol biopolymer transport system component
MDDAKDATAIWIYDLGSSTSPLRLTFGSANRYPLWTPDGERIVFQSNREKDRGLFWQRADGSGTAERLTTAEGKAEHAPQAWLPDRKTLIFSAVDGGNEGSLWSVSLEPGSKPKLLIDRIDAANQSASLSTDGHWIAYTLNESGRNIFVQPVPPTGAKYQITTEGGISPIWSPDGKQLIYSQSPGSGIGNLMLVDVETRPSFVFGKPTPLPIKGFWHNGAPGNPRGFDITPDGKQFIVMRPPDESNPRALRQINFIVNWFDELKQRVPVH